MDISQTPLKGVTVKTAWQFFAGWTSLLVTLLFTYFSIKASINDLGLNQSRIDAIQDIRIDAIKHDVELQELEIKNLDEINNEKNQK